MARSCYLSCLVLSLVAPERVLLAGMPQARTEAPAREARSQEALVRPEVLTLEAPIRRVRLHPEEAWVTRIGRVRLPGAGSYRLILEGLPPGLRLEDLQVQARGPAGTRLGDLGLGSDPRSIQETQEWKKLEAEREALRDRRDSLEVQSEAAVQELAYLKGIQAAQDKEIGARLNAAPPAPGPVLELGKAVQARTLELLGAQRRRKRELDRLAREEARLDGALQKKAGGQRAAPTRISLELSATQAGPVEVELSYRSADARWSPRYEARLSEDRRHLDLALFATVVQKTGEDWEGVRLEISNARPSKNLHLPEFHQPRALVWFPPGGDPTAPELAGAGLPAPPPPPPPLAPAEETRSGSAQRGAGAEVNFLMDLETEHPGTRIPQTQASVLEEASGLFASYLLEGPKEVPSDGEPHRFKVLSRELEPLLALFATPRLDPTAHLLARFPAPAGLPLFPGAPVLRFAGNQRLGEAPLVLPGAGRPFSLSFGPYKSLRLTLRRLEQKREEVGAFTKELQWTVRERLDIAHEGSEPVEMEVQDRMLRPASDQVKLSLLPTFAPDWTEPTPGVRAWKLKFAPGEHRSLDLSFTVRAPKEGVLLGLQDSAE